MTKRLAFHTTFILFLASINPLLAATPPKSNWDGTKASAGLSINTGNSPSSNINGELDLNYAAGRWKNIAVISGQYGKSAGVVNKSQYLIQNQVQYSLNNNPKIDNFIYTLGSFQNTEFGAFLNQTIFSIGYGRDWIKNEKYQLTTQIGPSYRRTASQGAPHQIDNALNASTSIIAVWNITPSLSLSENLAYTYGPPANFLNSTTSITTKLIKNLALSLSYNIQNWSKIPDNSDKKVTTDTATTANVVYSF